ITIRLAKSERPASLLQQLCAGVVAKCYIGAPLPSGRGSVGAGVNAAAHQPKPLLLDPISPLAWCPLCPWW
ncbi:MAG TPA: hypothetical protein VGQ81_11160, partial [Acidobacteriota bacterium]|nr:hypothetical protein [Acidobacteriota bacterium]